MQLRNINRMDVNQFANELSQENLDYIKDSFQTIEEALNFYRKSALDSAGRSMGEFMNAQDFFNALNNISSTEYI